jgi:hypothetical protein
VIKLDEVVYNEFTTYLDGYYQLKGLRRRMQPQTTRVSIAI